MILFRKSRAAIPRRARDNAARPRLKTDAAQEHRYGPEDEPETQDGYTPQEIEDDIPF